MNEVECEYKNAFQYALNRLARQNLLSLDLIKKFQQSNISEETIEKVIAECQRLGFINDSAWIEGFIKKNINRGLSPINIAYKLRGKGLQKEEFDSVLKKYRGSEEQKEQIANLLATKYKKKDLKNPLEKRKVVSSLVRKGFDIEAVLEIISVS